MTEEDFRVKVCLRHLKVQRTDGEEEDDFKTWAETSLLRHNGDPWSSLWYSATTDDEETARLRLTSVTNGIDAALNFTRNSKHCPCSEGIVAFHEGAALKVRVWPLIPPSSLCRDRTYDTPSFTCLLYHLARFVSSRGEAEILTRTNSSVRRRCRWGSCWTATLWTNLSRFLLKRSRRKTMVVNRWSQNIAVCCSCPSPRIVLWWNPGEEDDSLLWEEGNFHRFHLHFGCHTVLIGTRALNRPRRRRCPKRTMKSAENCVTVRACGFFSSVHQVWWVVHLLFCVPDVWQLADPEANTHRYVLLTNLQHWERDVDATGVAPTEWDTRLGHGTLCYEHVSPPEGDQSEAGAGTSSAGGWRWAIRWTPTTIFLSNAEVEEWKRRLGSGDRLRVQVRRVETARVCWAYRAISLFFSPASPLARRRDHCFSLLQCR